MAKKQRADVDFEGNAAILNLPAPAAGSNSPVRQADLESQLEGLASKDNVVVSTQSNIDLSAPGAAIDGITMTLNARFLVRSQTAGDENGIYDWKGAAVPATRSADASTSDELHNAVVSVDEGTDAGNTFRQTQVNFTLDTNDVIWTDFGGGVAAASETTAGKAELATQAETNTGTDDARIVTPLKLKTYSGRAKGGSETIGDAAATQFDFTHNENTNDVLVQVWDISGTPTQVDVEISCPTVNAVRVNFAVAPALNSHQVRILTNPGF